MKVPFVDLKANYYSIKEEIDESIKSVLENTAFILGKPVEEFEKNFAKYCDSNYCMGVNSGTAALHLALLAYGIKQGDEVITVPNTFFATAEAISHCNAVPKFVDIDEKTYTMDAEKLEKAITKKTKAIIPVHLFGQSADMKPIIEIAEKHGLIVLEDACQAHGAEFEGKKLPFAETGCFSFYPAKNLGAFGEAGAIVSSNEELIEKVKALRAHGENPKNVHSVIGYNYRLEGIQGAVLNAKLKHLDEWIEKRRANAKQYNELFQGFKPVILPTEASYAKHVFHLYVIQSAKRDELRDFLAKNEISTGIHYTNPIHLQKAYSFLDCKKGSFPVAEKFAEKIVSMPMYPELSSEQIEFTVEKTKEFFKKS